VGLMPASGYNNQLLEPIVSDPFGVRHPDPLAVQPARRGFDPRLPPRLRTAHWPGVDYRLDRSGMSHCWWFATLL
jgi:hypothetical protein